MSILLERVNETLNALSDLAGVGIAGNRLQARIELLHLVNNVLCDAQEDMRLRMIAEQNKSGMLSSIVVKARG